MRGGISELQQIQQTIKLLSQTRYNRTVLSNWKAWLGLGGRNCRVTKCSPGKNTKGFKQLY